MLILASASPRRQELLRAAGIAFDVRPASIPEEMRDGEAPQEFCERLAYEKANAVWQNIHDKNALVLGADTIVVVDHHILGKPTDADDARRMLRLISGRVHQVMTGTCLLGRNTRDVRTATTHVHVVNISEQEIEEYIANGEPMDKAGSYAIQGIASRWIPRIDGCYFNVVGLPIPMVYAMLRQAGM